MNIEYLREFVTIAHTGSYRKAANLLFSSVPTLSRHIKLLEHDLNTSLLKRDSHSVSLTNSGILLLESSKKILDNIDETYHLLNANRSINADRLVIAVHYADAYHNLFEQVKLFNRSFPFVDAEIKSYCDHTFKGSLLNNLADIAIEMYNPANIQEDIQYMAIGEVDISLGVPSECQLSLTSKVVEIEHLLIPPLSKFPGISDYLELVNKTKKMRIGDVVETNSIVEMFDKINESHYALIPSHYERLKPESITIYKLSCLPPAPMVALWNFKNHNPNIAKFIIHIMNQSPYR